MSLFAVYLMIENTEMKNLFKKYYYSTLRPDEFSAITKLLDAKQNDADISKAIKPLWDENLLENSELPNPNPALLQKIKEAIFLDERKAAQHKIKVYSLWLRIAAVLVIGLLAGNFFFFYKTGQKQYSGQLQTINTPYGAKTNITLPDGSKVWLNSGTTLSFPSVFVRNRPVTLVGEAFFEVVKSRDPFIVSTNYGEVEVKGTSFNVKAFSDDNSFETTLVEGIVTLKDKNTTNGVTLQPGQHAIQTANGYNIKSVRPELFTSWKEGKLVFEREPFVSFIKKLERWYNVKIDYNDPALNELWYTGSIEMESISEVMEMISKAAPVSYRFNNKTRIFTIKAKTK